MKKLQYFVIAGLLCGLSSIPVSGAQLKIATVAPDGSFWMKEMHKAADEIEGITGGRVKLRLYPGGTMGNDQAVLRKMRIGQLQGGMVTGQTLAEITKDLQAYGLPFLFRSYEEVDAVRKEIDPRLLEALQSRGYISFGLIEGGFVYILSNNPARSIEEFKGKKAWAPEGDKIAEAIYKAGGISPVSLPLSDVLTGLQTGLIDTVAGPPVAAVALQWFTRSKYLTDLPILYSYGSIIVSSRAFAKLSPEDRKSVQNILSKTSERLNERTRSDNLEARKALQKQGIKFVSVDSEALSQWRKIAVDATKRLKKDGEVPSRLLDEIEKILVDFRNEASGD